MDDYRRQFSGLNVDVQISKTNPEISAWLCISYATRMFFMMQIFSTLWLFDGDEIWLGGGGTRKQSVGDGWMSHEETR